MVSFSARLEQLESAFTLHHALAIPLAARRGGIFLGQYTPQPRTEEHDERRLLPRYRDRSRLHRDQSDALRTVMDTMSNEELAQAAARRHTPATLGGDSRRLRGIPAVSRDGMGGASPGTRPEDCLQRIDRQRERWAT